MGAPSVSEVWRGVSVCGACACVHVNVCEWVVCVSVRYVCSLCVVCVWCMSACGVVFGVLVS